MDAAFDVVLSRPHADRVVSLLDGSGAERAAYMLMGISRIGADPWSSKPRLRLPSHRFLEIGDEEIVSRSPTHVTWTTRGFMRLLIEAERTGTIPAIVHTHPGGAAFFSDQDDRNERELARTASNRGLPGLVSLVLGQKGDLRARMWTSPHAWVDASRVLITGRRIDIHPLSIAAAPSRATHLDRQARLFGDSFNQLIGSLNVGVIGCGGTGSAVATLLARLGVGRLLLIDRDRIETTNLNRVHGSRHADVVARRHKSTILRDLIQAADLGVDVVDLVDWVGNPACDDALKSCDVIFGCTDDHASRAFLNRLAYFYNILLIDLGLSMRAATPERGVDVTGRVSTHFPGHTCMMCAGLIDPRLAAEQALERSDPAEYARRKKEAYVIGGGDPAPAVVTFTTEAATMAVNTLIDALTGFMRPEGMVPMIVRKFHAGRDIMPVPAFGAACPNCGGERWGRGDVHPFLDVVR
jgi:hypothetical protein